MNTMKLFAASAFALAGALAPFEAFGGTGTPAQANDDVLVWYLDLEQSPNEDLAANFVNFDSVNLFAVAPDTGEKVYFEQQTYSQQADLRDGLNTGTTANIDTEHGFAGWYYTNLGTADYSGYEFMITLWDSNSGKMVAWTQSLYDPDPTVARILYSDLAGSIFSFQDLEDDMLPVGGTAFNFGTSVVPEPTSGLLLLVGGALLALRRRRDRA